MEPPIAGGNTRGTKCGMKALTVFFLFMKMPVIHTYLTKTNKQVYFPTFSEKRLGSTLSLLR